MSSNFAANLEEIRSGSSSHETAPESISTLSQSYESGAETHQSRIEQADGDSENHEFSNDDNSISISSEGWDLEAADAAENLQSMLEEASDVEEDGDAIMDARRRIRMRLLRLIQNGQIYGIVHDLDNEDDDHQVDGGWHQTLRRILPATPSRNADRFPKVPSEKGASLMDSGSFGFDEVETIRPSPPSSLAKKKKLAMRILERELAIQSPVRQRINQKLMAQGMIPSSNADTIIQFYNPVYSGQFSNDGTFFFSVNKDFKVHMYDTSNPYNWRYYKTVSYPFGRWTLTDASLSPDNKYLAYTSIQSIVCLAPTDPGDTGDPYTLDLADESSALGSRPSAAFGIWSIRYSGDGRQLVAGTTDGLIVVYDIESRRPIHRIYGHDEDVNAVSLADTLSPHILYSGSDDTTLKIWDTRSMGDNRAAGTFVGHIEGLTYIDSKGDGRYILSNGKDQSAKLWDVRMVMSPQKYEQIKNTRISNNSRFDYRFGRYNDKFWYKDPHDCSLVTYRGHRVLKTLIRCHFSPPRSTNSRYIYSGSEDGKVYIWNLDATLAGIVDVYRTTKPNTNFIDSEDPGRRRKAYEVEDWSTCVRDASWHPTAPVIATSAWNGYDARNGTCTLHTWNDDADDDEAEIKMGLRVDQKLRASQYLYQ